MNSTATNAAAPPTPTASRYRAYICYSHADKGWAAWLQRAIEWYVVPRKLRGRSTERGIVPRRVTPLFRDRTEARAHTAVYDVLFEALDASENMIVICSPSAAKSAYCNEEIRRFRRSGKGDRIFCMIVGGDPKATGENSPFPPALLEPLHDGVPPMPLATDVRPGEDGKRDAKLKLLAALLGVRFDELRRRDRDARRRQALRSAALAASFVLALVAVYYFALLAGQRPPGYRAVTAALSAHNLLLSEPIYGAADVADARASLERSVTSVLLKTGADTHWRWRSTPSANAPVDVWTAGQAMSGLLSDPLLSDARKRQIVERSLFMPMRAGRPVERGGVPYGWHGVDISSDIDETWPEEALWYASALSRAIAAPPAVIDGDRAAARAALGYVQHATDTYHDDVMGGWDGMANQTDKKFISTYATATALQALLDAKRAGQGWDGSTTRRDSLIRQTAGRLVGLMHPFSTKDPALADLYGWNGAADDENVYEEGLTLQTFTVLLRAEDEANYELPSSVVANIPKHLAQLATANYAGIGDAMSTSVHYREFVRLPNGAVQYQTRYIDFAWYPWGVACSALWLHRIRAHPETPSATDARRALGHLLVDLQDDATRGASNAYPWTAAELLVALDVVPPTDAGLRGLGFR
jgi:hypothetical protein